MSRRREQARFDRNFRRILSGAAKVFYEKGYARASLRDIARGTRVSLAGIYYYVSSKEEILYQIQKHCFLEVMQSLDRRLEGLNDPETKIRALIQNHLEFFVGNMREMKVLSHEGEALSGGYDREIEALKRDYVRRARGIVAEILRKHRIRDIDPGTAALCLFGMMNWIYNWYDPKRDGGARSLAETMAQLFLLGLVGARRRS